MMKVVVSGIRPTGRVHLGHLAGAIPNWLQLQHNYLCFFFIADLHAMTSHFESPHEIRNFTRELVASLLAFGVDPHKVILFEQSKITEHLELYYLLSCLTPVSWLERCPTYKEQIQNVSSRDLNNYAFLGYPLLQAADILLYKGQCVPVGEDQIPHIELAREIARKFNNLYRNFFPEPQPLLTSTPRLLGIDNRKMSKSYNNTVDIADTDSQIHNKIMQMFTDPSRIHRTDPGHPDICNVYSYYKIFVPQDASTTEYECKNAIRGCTDCKELLANKLLSYLAPFREKINDYLKYPEKIETILQEGNKKAKAVASKNIAEIKQIVFG
ncbi:MAG: tryptophan--tRNA ligase [Planctomycetota bacterium]